MQYYFGCIRKKYLGCIVNFLQKFFLFKKNKIKSKVANRNYYKGMEMQLRISLNYIWIFFLILIFI